GFQRRASRRLSGAFTNLDTVLGAEEAAPPVPALPGSLAGAAKGAGAGSGAGAGAGTGAGEMRPPPPLQTSRPSSAMGMRGADLGIQVAKLRAPTKARKPPPAPTTNGAVPGPPARPTPPTRPSVSTPALATATPVPSVVPVQPMAPKSTNADMDQLASGLKRISLKLGSKAESERKAGEREAAERRARALKGAETRRVNAAAKKEKARESVGAQAQVIGKADGGRVSGTPSLDATDGAADAAAGAASASHSVGNDPPLGKTHSSPPQVPEQVEAPEAESLPWSQPTEESLSDAAPPSSVQSKTEQDPSMLSEVVPTATPMVSQAEVHTSPPPASDGEARLLPGQEGLPDGATAARLTADTSTPTSPLQPPIPRNDRADDTTSAPPSTTPTSPSTSPLRSPTRRPPPQKAPRLPTWSSTGPIPFATTAAGPAHSPNPAKPRANRGSPCNPPSFTTSPRRRGPDARVVSHGNGVSRTMLGSRHGEEGEEEEEIVMGLSPVPTPGVEKTAREAGGDLWAVPVTPRGKMSRK
ncbi:histone deacetylase, partial [Teratosphaeriaceae sp. CCFEE 6253]